MDRITALKARRAGTIDKMEAILASIPEDGEMTAEQAAQFEALKAEDDKAARDLKAAEEIEARKASLARVAAPLPGVTPAPGAQASAPAAVAEKGLKFARMMRTMAAAGGVMHVAAQIAEANGDSGLFANQNTQSGAAGGFLVPEDVAAEVIELLRPTSVVMAMGPQVLPMPNGNLTLNRRTTGATFRWGGEQADIQATGVTFGQVRLSAKKLSGIIPMSNEFLRFPSTAGDRVIRDDALRDIAVAVDQGYLRGPGTEFAPLGLRNMLTGTTFAATNVIAANATVNLANVTIDAGKLELAQMNANVDPTGSHWIMSPRSAMYLMNLRDGNGNLAFPEVQDGRWRRKPVHVTTSIPDNLGSGSDSEILLVNPAHILIGEVGGLDVALSSEAAYKDSSGTMQAAFSRDETLMRLIMFSDIGTRHLPAISVLTGVTWA